MEPKRRVIVYLDTRDVTTLKLDALLNHSTVSARLRKVVTDHCRRLAAGHPRSLFEAQPQQEATQ